MEPAYIIILFVIVFAFVKYLKFKKRRNEDAIIKSYNRNKRVAYQKSKPANGKQRSKEEIEKDNARYAEHLAENSRRYSEAERIKQSRLGIKRYIWRSCEDGDECAECAKNNGKTFSWSKPPKSGHPGEGKCCPDGRCRCYPEAKL
ncbi:TPA: hypothetical protein JLS02_001922 [Escherichia coli]|nr:hypothetical protein [Escherichia coli]